MKVALNAFVPLSLIVVLLGSCEPIVSEQASGVVTDGMYELDLSVHIKSIDFEDSRFQVELLATKSELQGKPITSVMGAYIYLNKSKLSFSRIPLTSPLSVDVRDSSETLHMDFNIPGVKPVIVSQDVSVITTSMVTIDDLPDPRDGFRPKISPPIDVDEVVTVQLMARYGGTPVISMDFSDVGSSVLVVPGSILAQHFDTDDWIWVSVLRVRSHALSSSQQYGGLRLNVELEANRSFSSNIRMQP